MERVLLLVDDEENIAAAIVRLLHRDGYKILRAKGGKEGLELLSQNQVGVIISDQRMPEMTGVEFLSKVKELYPETVRIVLSGYTDLNSVTDAINRGAIYKFLTKPWEDDLLRENVEEAFKRYELKLENVRLTQQLQAANEALSDINYDLEQRVADATREILRNFHALQISQDILDSLPVAVVGVGDDGLIAVANQRAHKLFGMQGKCPLLGEMAREVLPEVLLTGLKGHALNEQPNKEQMKLVSGDVFNYWCYSMSATSHVKGVILVADSDVLATGGDL
ncbi:response regulator [Sulfuriferula nivalis]|uniref:Response regulatory domain-containing protein n=1 Tax=Sulfuriferula nivalis TaxID=2675298 RepID=A0A809RDK0_9PROT|nr:response regulator [Sulfuriferula nivalis]BBO99725.1 hypothetical protein SFSGTM_04340 [Sulfuriferula nivalis]